MYKIIGSNFRLLSFELHLLSNTKYEVKKLTTQTMQFKLFLKKLFHQEPRSNFIAIKKPSATQRRITSD